MDEAKWKDQKLEAWYQPHSDPRLVFEGPGFQMAGRWVWTGDTRDEDNGKALNEEMKARWNALPGITNVEALGALLKASKVLREAEAGDFNSALAAWTDAYDALYAPQASEAKP